MTTELSNANDNPSTQSPEEALFEKFYSNPESITDDGNAGTAAPETPSAPAAPAKEPEQADAPGDVGSTPQEAETSKSPSDEPEWMATLPQEAKQLVENLQKQAGLWQSRHQEQSSKNRKMHNEVESLKRKVNELSSSQQAPANKPSDSATGNQIDEVEEQLKTADPVLAQYLERKLKALEDKLKVEQQSVVQERFAPIEQNAREQFMQQQLSMLDEAVPNWREIATDPQFIAWKDTQSPAVQSLYNEYAADNVRLLVLYDQDMSRYYGGTTAPAPQAQPTPTGSGQAAKVAEQRQQRLERSAPVSPNAPAAVQPRGSASPEELFQKFYANPEAVLGMIQPRS